jgi:hypothetical protein
MMSAIVENFGGTARVLFALSLMTGCSGDVTSPEDTDSGTDGGSSGTTATTSAGTTAGTTAVTTGATTATTTTATTTGATTTDSGGSDTGTGDTGTGGGVQGDDLVACLGEGDANACDTTSQVCCVAGMAATCEDTASCSDSVFACDGPEDCAGVCCFDLAAGSSCQATAADCTGAAAPACHSQADCDSGTCMPPLQFTPWWQTCQ